MSGKTEVAYTKIFQVIKFEVWPEMNPKTWMADFEDAQSNALENNYPNAELQGCYFHYTQVSINQFEVYMYIYLFDFNTPVVVNTSLFI